MAQQVGFRRNMGLFMAVMIGIGASMGPGIFALPGELAHMIGPLWVLVYLAMGFMTVFTALNYSELKIPEECLIAAVVRDNELVVPRGRICIEVEDRVVFIGPAAVVRRAADMFTEAK